MFKEISNRDAWSTIRGFVYQVDLTILRWLNLDENTILQLERGEDIDIVNRNISKGEVSRELEQIKYRELEITLNSDFVLEMILNFYIQKQNNPRLNLYFRFVTNSDYTTERPAIFQETGEAGINEWIRLFNDSTLTDTDIDLLIIKKHLLKNVQREIDKESKAKKPKVEYLTNLKALDAFLQQPDGFAAFVKSFEWSLQNEDAVQMPSVIKDSLIVKKYAIDSNATKNIYPCLFLHVFKLLTSSALKQLTRNDLLDQLKLPELNSEDKKLLPNLIALLSDIEGRVSDLEDKVSINTGNINSLLTRFEVLSKADAVFDLKIKNLSVSPPSIIRHGSLRKTKVKEIVDKFSSKSWLAFQGINGTGKSQLASLICLQFTNHYWLELRPFYDDPEKTAILLEKFLEFISGELIINDRKAWILKLIGKLPGKALIVLNDLPRVVKDSPLEQLLVFLSDALIGTDIKVITTSNYNIPQFVKNGINEEHFEEHIDFKFNDDEIIEYLVNSGADSAMAKYVKLISAVTSYNPRLVGAVIIELKRLNWGKGSQDLFEAFFNKNFTTEIIADAQNSIKQFISNEQSRELLYRLTLIHWSFSFEDIQKISLVQKEIAHPHEKLSDLLNLWIQEQKDKLYQISPLIYDLGEKNLEKSVIEGTHLAIAKSLIQGKKVDQITASRSIMAFIKGNDFNSAGSLLLNIYQLIRNVNDIESLKGWGFIDYWANNDIPERMAVVLRIFIRSEQIRIGRLQAKPNPFLKAQLEKYLHEKNLKSSEKILIHFATIGNFDGSNASAYWTHLDGIINEWSTIEEEYKKVINPENLLRILWIPILSLNNSVDIKRWLNIISKLENILWQSFFKDELAETAVAALAHNIANSKSNSVGNEDILSLLYFLSTYFKNCNEEVLEAIMFREVVANMFLVQNKINEAHDLALKKIASFKNDSAKFVLTDILGKLYHNSKDEEKGREWLLKAVAYQRVEQVNFTETLIYAATTVSELDTQKAYEYCYQAVQIIESKEDYHELDYIQMLSELGLACYNNKKFVESFTSFEKAVVCLFSSKGKIFAETNRFYPKEDWIRMYVLLGHTLGYIGNLLVHNKIPQTHGGDFTKPFQGVFSFNKNNLSDLYKITNDPILMSQMALFAEGVNHIEKAYMWSLKAFDLARKNGKDDVFLMVSALCCQYSLVNEKYDEAFESNLLFAAVSSHLKGESPEKFVRMENTTISEVIKSKPSDEWNSAEDTTVSTTVIPMLMQVLSSKLTTDLAADDKQSKFLHTLKDYEVDSSDKELWQDLHLLCSVILNRTISAQELINKSNEYSENGRRTLQLICILGLIYFDNKDVKVLKEIINIYPHFANTFEGFITTKKYIIVPFLKVICDKVLSNNFVGDKKEYQTLLKQMNEIEAFNENCYQYILQPIVACFQDDVEIEESRRRWLYEYTKI